MLPTENVLGLRKIVLTQKYQEITPYEKNGLISLKEDFVTVLTEGFNVVAMTWSQLR